MGIEFEDLETLRITGTKVHYLQVCHRKLWLFPGILAWNGATPP